MTHTHTHTHTHDAEGHLLSRSDNRLLHTLSLILSKCQYLFFPVSFFPWCYEDKSSGVCIYLGKKLCMRLRMRGTHTHT